MAVSAQRQGGSPVRCVLVAVLAAVMLSGCEDGGPFAPAGDPEAEAALEAAAQTLKIREGPAAEADAESADGGQDPAADDADASGAGENPVDAESAEAEAEAEPGGDDAETEAEEEPEPPARNAAAKAACERKGGFFSVTGGGKAGYCARRTRDANKQCSKSSDCEGYCLARSRTCAPIAPLIGCHDVLTDRGVASSICVN